MDRASSIKADVHALGHELGFETSEEINRTYLSVYLDQHYVPQVDVVWYLDLEDLGIDTAQLASALEETDAEPFSKFPVVAFEIEASDPTTKTMETDMANLSAIGALFGVLLVDTDRGSDLYRRANRVLRTFRTLHGMANFVCLEKSQLHELLAHDWSSTSIAPREPRHKQSGGAGGEVGWTTATRRELADLGREIGFTVKEDWVPADLKRAVDRKRSQWDAHPDTSEFAHHSWTAGGERRRFNRWNYYYTQSKIDVSWVAPYPRPLRKLLTVLPELEPDLQTHTPLIKAPDSLHPFVGFELETSAGKHAGGGILNLGAYTTIGEVVVPDESMQRDIERKIETYQQTIGLQNIETMVW